MKKKVLIIEGMKCENCAKHVKEALKKVEGVKSAMVNLEEKMALIELTHNVDDEKLRESIEGAGYKLVSIEEPIS